VKYPIKYYINIKDAEGWLEAKQLDYGTYIKGLDDTHPAILVWNKEIPFGVLQEKAPNAYYLYDIDGDGKLDYRSDYLDIHIFITINNSPVHDPSLMS